MERGEREEWMGKEQKVGGEEGGRVRAQKLNVEKDGLLLDVSCDLCAECGIIRLP